MTNALPTLSQNQARQLRGSTWTIGSKTLTFGYQGTKRRLHWRTGGEAIAYAMTDKANAVRGYLRFLDAANPRLNTEKRIQRTEWLIGQRLDLLSPHFSGAPSAWVSSFVLGRPPGADFDLTATFLEAVPGKTWRDWKTLIDQGSSKISIETRFRAAKELLEALAAIETLGLVHGDLSDGNIVIDSGKGAQPPGLYLIDFDAFVAEQLPPNLRSLSFADGGVVGTPGYCPPELNGNQSPDARPYSDKHARDMLLIELLCFRAGDPTNQSPLYWSDESEVLHRTKNAASELGLSYLSGERILTLRENDRPSSTELSRELGLTVKTLAPLSDAVSPVPRKGDRKPRPRRKPKPSWAASAGAPTSAHANPTAPVVVRTAPSPYSGGLLATIVWRAVFHLLRIIFVGPVILISLFVMYFGLGIVLVPFGALVGKPLFMLQQVLEWFGLPLDTYFRYWAIVSGVYFLFGWPHLLQDRLLPEPEPQ